jgi:hypothetical protein
MLRKSDAGKSISQQLPDRMPIPLTHQREQSIMPALAEASMSFLVDVFSDLAVSRSRTIRSLEAGSVFAYIVASPLY